MGEAAMRSYWCPPPLKGKIGNHGARGLGIDMLAKARVPLVESKMAARHKGLDVHESYMQGCQETRDQKYEAQMLDPSSVVKYVAPTTSANSNVLIGVPDEIVPRKGTMLEFKTRGIFNLPVAPTPLLRESLAEQAIGKTQETTTAKMPTRQTTVEPSAHHEPSSSLPPHGEHYPPPPRSSQFGFASPYEGLSSTAEHHYFSSNSHINYGYPAAQHQQWPLHFGLPPPPPPPPRPYPYYHYPPYGPW
jgi:hypothetical protein